MICNDCKKDLPLSDFLLGKDCCYHCIYVKKSSLLCERQKKRSCVICKKELIKSKWRYCSDECSEIGTPKKRWYQKINIENKNFNVRLSKG